MRPREHMRPAQHRARLLESISPGHGVLSLDTGHVGTLTSNETLVRWIPADRRHPILLQ